MIVTVRLLTGKERVAFRAEDVARVTERIIDDKSEGTDIMMKDGTYIGTCVSFEVVRRHVFGLK